jgi:hypothetical protein
MNVDHLFCYFLLCACMRASSSTRPGVSMFAGHAGHVSMMLSTSAETACGSGSGSGMRQRQRGAWQT